MTMPLLLEYAYGKYITSAPRPNRAPSQNLVLALWNTAALFVHQAKIHIPKSATSSV